MIRAVVQALELIFCPLAWDSMSNCLPEPCRNLVHKDANKHRAQNQRFYSNITGSVGLISACVAASM